MKKNVLVIADPDEWVQTGRPPYVISLSSWNSEKFGQKVLHMTGEDIREWLRMNGVRLLNDVRLSKIDYVVCS